MAIYNRLLGFDFGTKRIGVAYGQMITKKARPLTTIKNKETEPDWHAIAQLIKQWQPNAFIVGLPLNMDDTPQDITKLVDEFAQQLKSRFNLPTFLIDERLTTVSARESVFAEGGYKALKNTEIDAIAAKLILESWMNQQA